MDPEHFTGERVEAEEQIAPGRNHRTASRRLPRHCRICMLLIFVMFGLNVLTPGPGAGSGKSISGQQIASGLTGLVSEPGASLEVGLGAGASTGGMVADVSSTFVSG